MAYSQLHPFEFLGNFFEEVFDFLKLILILTILVVLVVRHIKKKKNRAAFTDGLPKFFITKPFKILIYVFLSLLAIDYSFNIWKNIDTNALDNKKNKSNTESYLDVSTGKRQTRHLSETSETTGKVVRTLEDSAEVYTAVSGIEITNHVITTSDRCGLSIGDTSQGGIIFYLDASGCHGLISASKDQSSGIQWWNDANIDTYAYGNGIGAGKGNVGALQRWQGQGNYASSTCYNILINGHTDWYLPSTYELNLMYMNIGQGNSLKLGNIGGFSPSKYWSSTEHGPSIAWYIDFNTGVNDGDLKSKPFNVRAVRVF